MGVKSVHSSDKIAAHDEGFIKRFDGSVSKKGGVVGIDFRLVELGFEFHFLLEIRQAVLGLKPKDNGIAKDAVSHMNRRSQKFHGSVADQKIRLAVFYSQTCSTVFCRQRFDVHQDAVVLQPEPA